MCWSFWSISTLWAGSVIVGALRGLCHGQVPLGRLLHLGVLAVSSWHEWGPTLKAPAVLQNPLNPDTLVRRGTEKTTAQGAGPGQALASWAQDVTACAPRPPGPSGLRGLGPRSGPWGVCSPPTAEAALHGGGGWPTPMRRPVLASGSLRGGGDGFENSGSIWSATHTPLAMPQVRGAGVGRERDAGWGRALSQGGPCSMLLLVVAAGDGLSPCSACLDSGLGNRGSTAQGRTGQPGAGVGERGQVHMTTH